MNKDAPSIYMLLGEIQGKVKVIKSKENKFGKYNYRDAEDILREVNPVLREYGCTLTVSDSLIMIGDRYYVNAIASIFNPNGMSVSASAIAREPSAKKGMDESQITLAASSYARKQALGGLFCVDDGTRESDKKGDTPSPSKPTNLSKLKSMCAIKGVDTAAMFASVSVDGFDSLSDDQINKLTKTISKRADK